eukprot:12935649-Prorocentrum_lima.AAC.1
MAMLDEDEQDSLIGRVRQWLRVRQPQTRDARPLGDPRQAAARDAHKGTGKEGGVATNPSAVGSCTR